MCDLYPQPFRLLLPDGKDKYRTFAGTLLSIGSLLVIISYAVYHLIGLMSNGEYLVQLQDYENFYATSDAFGADDGFMVAAAVTNFDGSNVDITDPEIGEIKFYLKHWNIDVEKHTIDFKEIESKVCTEADLNDHEGTNSDVSSFYPIEKSSI